MKIHKLTTAIVATAALALAGCSGNDTESQATDPARQETTEAVDETDDADDHEEEATSEVTEVAGPRTRLVVTYDGGVGVIDATSLELVAA